jgi:hypothetical protein
MMNDCPMLADFAIRLAFGLAVSLLAISVKAVPLQFFRTQSHVVLGLLVLSALDLARAGGNTWGPPIVVAGAVMAYFSAVTWGLGLPRLGAFTSAMVAVITTAWLVTMAIAAPVESSVLLAGGRITSGFLLGTTLTAMLLGHHYLTAPAMSIEPLKRIVLLMALALSARCAFAGAGLWEFRHTNFAESASVVASSAITLVATRWGMGFVGTAVATYLTWRTAQIRSTQSATGILYITMIFVLFGELTSMILAVRAGPIC